MKNLRNIILLCINIFLFISTLIIAIFGVIYGASEGQVGGKIIGIGYFKPFTIDSNILMGLCALILSIYIIITLVKKDHKIPYWVNIIYYAGVTSVSLTILTVIFFLTPSIVIKSGWGAAAWLYLKDMFFFHVLNPILSIVSFMLLKSERQYTWKENLISIIPMGIYTIVYLFNVVIFKNWSDFYGFTFGGQIQFVPLVIVVMFLVTYLIGFILRLIKKLIDKKTIKKELPH